MTVIELRFEEPDADHGAVVGAVQILDEKLVTVATSVLRADKAVPVELPGGRYFADGWSPDGARLHGAVDTAESPLLRVERQERPASASPHGSVRVWWHHGRDWTPGATADTADFLRCDDNAGSAVVWTPASGASQVFVVPTWTDLVVSADGVGVRPGLGATLLGYRHRGDGYSARVVVKEAIATGGGSDVVADIMTGYYLVCGGNAAARDWMSRLAWFYADSVDVMVLNAQLMLREAGTVPTAREELHRAVSGGLPFVAEGLRLLAAGLALLGESSPVRHYTAAQLGTALTSFWGEDPRVPRRKPASSGDVEPCDNDVPVAVPVPPRETEREQRPLAGLSEALDALNGAGLVPADRQVDVGDLRLNAVIDRNISRTDRLDLDLWVKHLAGLRGLTVGVRESAALHHLGSFDDRGRLRVTGLRPGQWAFSVCEPPARSRFAGPVAPLPVAAPALELLAAAGEGDREEVLRVSTPPAVLVLFRERHGGRFRLEASRPRGDDQLAIGVEYGTTAGETALRVAPYPIGRRIRRETAVEFDDFDAGAHWQVAELTPADIALLDPADLVPSLTPAFAAAWRELAEHLPDAHRALVDRYLG
ncbi:hypothetical protein [Lentzea sp. NPDC092896]|uniref:hypothetical protein n=1 Tax=Lentzea sp. NPDC092896 TaxID=3364127 RepID=UPI0037F64E25